MRRLSFFLGILIVSGPSRGTAQSPDSDREWQLPNEALITPFKNQVPLLFVNRAQQPAEWDKLPAFWNESSESAVDPKTGHKVERKAIRIKVPLGLTQNPPVP